MIVAHTLTHGYFNWLYLWYMYRISAVGFYAMAIIEDCSNDGLNSSLAFLLSMAEQSGPDASWVYFP
eukprot:11836398-Ditylum_brightwellii.AAC.1